MNIFRVLGRDCGFEGWSELVLLIDDADLDAVVGFPLPLVLCE